MYEHRGKFRMFRFLLSNISNSISAVDFFILVLKMGRKSKITGESRIHLNHPPLPLTKDGSAPGSESRSLPPH